MSRKIDTRGKTEPLAEQQNAGQGNKLLFTSYNGQQGAFLIQDNRLKAARLFSRRPSKIGAVYICRVKNIAQNLNAYFVEIGGAERETCFLSAKDAAQAHLLNRAPDGRILIGDEFPVQVTRDAAKNKQASVTTLINRPDLELLLQTAAHRTCFSLLCEAPAPWEAALDDLVNPHEYAEIVTDDPALYEKLCTSGSVPAGKQIRLYGERDSALLSLAKVYALDSKMEEALSRHVWLKSGGYLVIDPTEALTVIDVNSGKFEAGKAAEEAHMRINMEAAAEIALQLRLRNLSGMIVVDFINMKSAEKQQELLEFLRELAKKDRQKTVIVDMTPLGLVEITRKKSNKPLSEQFEAVRKPKGSGAWA